MMSQCQNYLWISKKLGLKPKFKKKRKNNHLIVPHVLLVQRRRHQYSSHMILGDKPQVPCNDLKMSQNCLRIFSNTKKCLTFSKMENLT